MVKFIESFVNYTGQVFVLEMACLAVCNLRDPNFILPYCTVFEENKNYQSLPIFILIPFMQNASLWRAHM